MACVTTQMVGRGIYDLTEAARLVRVHPDTLAGWTTGDGPLVAPAFGQLFDFEDLVSLLVISQLWRRGVASTEIRRGVELLADELEVHRPLAHAEAPKRLATVGSAFFAHIGEWADAGKGFQLAFQPMIEPVLRPLEYDTSGMAHLWRPAEHVTARPVVQAGSPCVESTRVPTSVIAGLLDAGEDLDDVAFDLDLQLEQIESAVRFEKALSDRLLAKDVLVH